MMNNDRKELDAQTLSLVEAEGKLRVFVKREWLKNTPQRIIVDGIRNIIESALRPIVIPSLKDGARRSLWHFAYRQLATWKRLDGEKKRTFLAVLRLEDKWRKDLPQTMTVSRAKEILAEAPPIVQGSEIYDSFQMYGEPLQKYHQAYMKENVTPILRELESQYPIDYDEIAGADNPLKALNKRKNSLRLKAELEVRYRHNQDMQEELRASGTRLVICSVHADCSKRCRPWQGRVYSLDGTRGKTADGRQFVPIETATDIWYKTKAGRLWKNGLLGFNCRHQLLPYKDGMRFPTPSPKEEKEQYRITETQRAMERRVRLCRLREEMLKGVGTRAEIQSAKKASKTALDAYIQYSQKNGRAYYPSRVKLL